jgi:hypothetical protein
MEVESMKHLKSIIAMVMVVAIGVCLLGCQGDNFDDYFTDVNFEDGVLTLSYDSGENEVIRLGGILATCYIGTQDYIMVEMGFSGSARYDSRYGGEVPVEGTFSATFEDLTEEPEKIAIEFNNAEGERVVLTKNLK